MTQSTLSQLKTHPILNYRLRMGLSQTQLAKIIKVRQHTISDWENNVSLPRSPYYARIAMAFGMEVSKIEREIRLFYYREQVRLLESVTTF